MGIVIPFRPRAKSAPNAGNSAGRDLNVTAEQAVVAARDRGGDRYEVLDAAAELLAVCRDCYGFTVMQDGLPREPEALAHALVALLRGLTLLDAECAAARMVPGVGVYFGRPALQWFEDGCGGRTGLAVPDAVDAVAFAQFVRPRLTGTRL